MLPYRDLRGKTDGKFYCDIRKQTCYEVVLLVCHYPSIGDDHVAMNWVHLYQVWRKERRRDTFLLYPLGFCHTYFKHLIYNFLVNTLYC